MKHTRILSKALCLLLCLTALLSLTACGETKMSQSQVFAMDTVMTLTAYGGNREAGLAAAQDVITSLDVMLDPELSTSMVYAMNHAQGANVTVSGQIANMLDISKTIYKQSGGALDLTVYPLLKRWGFIDSKYYVPTGLEITEDLARLCFDKLTLTSFPSSGSYSVSMPSYGMLSFGAVAKGCASNNAINAMRQAGVKSGIVSLGGNVQTLGYKPDGSEWNIAIEDPNNTSSYIGVINVGETAVVTSGSYQRFFKDPNRNKTYHHIINPATGLPTVNSLLSATVVCSDGATADALSTAMFVLGENKSLTYWRTYGGFDMILVTNNNEIICTSGLIEKFTLANSSYSLRFTE